MQTKLKTSITSGYPRNTQQTKNDLAFLDKLTQIWYPFYQRLPKDPEFCTNGSQVQFKPDPRVKELLKKFETAYEGVKNISEEISTLQKTLALESGQNQLEYLEEITDLIPFGWKLTTEIKYDNHPSIEFNFALPAKDYPDLAKFQDLCDKLVKRKTYHEQAYLYLNREYADSYWPSELEDLKDNRDFENAKLELLQIRRYFKSLIERGFNTTIKVSKVSSRSIIINFKIWSNLR
jgi:hypothetical protein